MAARISEIFLFKKPTRKGIFFSKESKSNKKKKFWLLEGEGVGCVARLSDFFFQNPSLKTKFCFLFEGVKVREDWLV